MVVLREIAFCTLVLAVSLVLTFYGCAGSEDVGAGGWVFLGFLFGGFVLLIVMVGRYIAAGRRRQAKKELPILGVEDEIFEDSDSHDLS